MFRKYIVEKNLYCELFFVEKRLVALTTYNNYQCMIVYTINIKTNILFITEQYSIGMFLDPCVKTNAECSSWQQLCVCHCNLDYVMVSGNCVKGMFLTVFFCVMYAAEIEISLNPIIFDAFLQRAIQIVRYSFHWMFDNSKGLLTK